MSAAAGRIQIAQAQLAVLGEFQPGEPAEVTDKREHYQRMLEEAQAEVSEAHHRNLPYKDD